MKLFSTIWFILQVVAIVFITATIFVFIYSFEVLLFVYQKVSILVKNKLYDKILSSERKVQKRKRQR